MVTDWMLVRRLAHEIEAQLRGAKVRDAGLLPDGRPAIVLWTRGRDVLLCLDLFGTPPVVTLETGELPIAPEPGFIRALATTLRQMTLVTVKSRREDRLLRLTFGARSRFGVGDEVELYVELVPKFGNAILVKGDVIIAAMKEFSLADNGTRAIQAGHAYQLPPLLRRNHAVEQPAPGDELLTGPVYVYRNDRGTVERIRLRPDGDGVAIELPSILDAFALYRDNRLTASDHASASRKRAALEKRLRDREKKLLRERESIAAKFETANGRESVKAEGEAIFATLHDQPADARDEAVERAQALFARYKKLGNSLPHLEQRRDIVGASLRAIDDLRWELERARDEDLPDVESAVDQIDGSKTNAPRANTPQKRRRKPMEVRTPDGSRILIGRTPLENADLTFRVARPDDLWFHAQNIPGAHVILQRDDREQPTERDVALAAGYAAGHSKARANQSVPVDYTYRKYVRKRKDAAPGLVWYTTFKTVVAKPTEFVVDR